MTEEEMKAEIARIQKEAEAKLTAEVHKRNEENQSLRARLKTVSPKALAIYDRLREGLGKDDIEDSDIEDILGANTGKSALEQRLGSLERSLKQRDDSLRQVSEKLADSEKRNREKQRDDAIRAELEKLVIPGALASSVLIANASASYDEDSGKWTFGGKNAADAAAQIVKDNPWLKRNNVGGGNGNSSEPNAANREVPDFISEEEYMKMTPAQQQDPKVRERVHRSMDRWGK